MFARIRARNELIEVRVCEIARLTRLSGDPKRPEKRLWVRLRDWNVWNTLPKNDGGRGTLNNAGASKRVRMLHSATDIRSAAGLHACVNSDFSEAVSARRPVQRTINLSRSDSIVRVHVCQRSVNGTFRMPGAA